MVEGNRTVSTLFLTRLRAWSYWLPLPLGPGTLPNFDSGTSFARRLRLSCRIERPGKGWSWVALRCGRGIDRIAEIGPDRLILRPIDGCRRIQLTWHHPAGEWELSDRLAASLQWSRTARGGDRFANSALTEALARTLAASGPATPPLLIPSASAVGLPGRILLPGHLADFTRHSCGADVSVLFE